MLNRISGSDNACTIEDFLFNLQFIQINFFKKGSKYVNSDGKKNLAVSIYSL